MRYCCEKAKDEFGGASRFGLFKTNLFVLGAGGETYCMDIKFCPFCGKDLAPRFILKEDHNTDDISWAVWDTLRNRIVGYFDTLKPAEEMLKRCK